MERRLITNGLFASFEQLISGNKIYVDKTKFACELANDEGAFLLARPRRMGKSTMVSTLEYLFSKGTVGTEGLYCHEHWPDPNRYFVFNLSFSKLDSSSVEAFTYNFFRRLKVYANYFGVEIHQEDPIHQCFEQLVLQCLTKLSDKSFIADHPELQDGDRPLCTERAVLLIDEYDTPLTENLDNKVVFDAIKRVYRRLFASIKDIDFRFVFVTGVSSYAQTSIFSGANQFINISLDKNLATCCGYTQEELEHYLAPELENAQQTLKLSHDELMSKLRYFYDGYLFCITQKYAISCNKIFNPVSVSLFLRNPEDGFLNYWIVTGAQSTFFLKLLKLSSSAVITQFMADLCRKDKSSVNDIDPKVLDYMSAWLPVLELSVDYDEQNNHNNRLLRVSADLLILNIDQIDKLDNYDSVAILFQSGYLAIKAIEENEVLLGLANHEVASALKSLLSNPKLINSHYPYGLSTKLSMPSDSRDEIYAALHEGGYSLAKLFDDMLNTSPSELFGLGSRENFVTYIIAEALLKSKIPLAQEVNYLLGRADLVIYKPDQNPLLEDTVIEFKLARKGENVFTKLEEGTRQVIDKRYGISSENPNPYRYCVVFSNELRQVAAIKAINADGGSKTVYVSDRLEHDGAVNKSSS
ncbi:AAA family ATPase [Anaerobiospirillum succiniciproducens]|uniref:AAA family ATPase n=1 Tax=Anaerobiospirillum succiniciproducens TaxID=13335 RepID=UPI003F8BD7CE